MHVFPGLNYFKGWKEIFWHQEFTETMEKILDNHQHSIKFLSGSHIHRTEFRDPFSHGHASLSIPFLISPSVSPVYLNNPGFTTMTIRDSHIQSLKVWSFQLPYFIAFGLANVWSVLDPLKTFKFDFNKPNEASMRKIFDLLESPSDYGHFLGYEMGYDYYFSFLVLGQVIMPLYMMYVDPNALVYDACFMIFMDPQSIELETCLTQSV